MMLQPLLRERVTCVRMALAFGTIAFLTLIFWQ
jgi:hypothetical protein